MESSSIKDRFTLPESRRACRAGDIPVSTEEYRRLQGLNHESDKPVTGVALDQIKGEVAEGCKEVIIRRDFGPKAAKASALREHDKEQGFKNRIERIGRAIIGTVIAEFKEQYTVEDLFNGGIPYEDTFAVDSVKVPPMGWTDDGEDNDALQSPSEDMRENFLYELRLFVETEIHKQMIELLKIEFDGESIWDNLRIRVNLDNSYTYDSGSIGVDMFFADIEEVDK